MQRGRDDDGADDDDDSTTMKTMTVTIDNDGKRRRSTTTKKLDLVRGFARAKIHRMLAQNRARESKQRRRHNFEDVNSGSSSGDPKNGVIWSLTRCIFKCNDDGDDDSDDDDEDTTFQDSVDNVTGMNATTKATTTTKTTISTMAIGNDDDGEATTMIAMTGVDDDDRAQA